MTDISNDTQYQPQPDWPCGPNTPSNVNQATLGKYVPVCQVDADTTYPLLKLRSAMRACGNTDRGDPFVLGPCDIAMYVEDDDNTSAGSNAWLDCLRSEGIGLYETVHTGPEQAYGTICQYPGWDHPPYDESKAYAGFLAGVILGSLAAVILLITSFWCWRTRRRRRRTNEATTSSNQTGR